MTSSKHTFPGPVFVGGSGRSGTHAMTRLVGAGERYHPIRVEARFHSGRGGLGDLLAGETDVDSYVRRFREKWWRRGVHQSGLHKIMKPAQIDAALDGFADAYRREPWEASRELIETLLGAPAAAAGKPSWVEASGGNIRTAHTLLRLFPHARFINMFRDGRAVVAGIVRKAGMSDDPLEALDHWEKRTRIAHEVISTLPPETILTVPLDDLTAFDREGTYRRLAAFLEVEDDVAMRAYFDERISGERAHVGGWRERMAPPDVRRVERRYRHVVRELHREGIDWVPDPEPGGRFGPVRIPALGRR